MATFKYRARKSSGVTIETVISAPTEEKAREKIAALGYVLESLAPLTGPDRRMFQRYALSLEMSFCRFNVAETKHSGRTIDLSAGGIAFLTDRALAPGMIITITVALREGPFEVLARVMRAHQQSENTFFIAAYFIELSNHERIDVDKRLRQQCADNNEQQGG